MLAKNIQIGNSYECFLYGQIAIGTLDSRDTNGFIMKLDSGAPIEDRIINNLPKLIGYMSKGEKRIQNGSNVLFTGKQYVFTTNLGDGEIGHVVSIAKTMLEIRGNHSILSYADARRVYANYKDNYLRLRISSENHGCGEMHYTMRLYHKKDRSISPEELASFEDFVRKFGMYFSMFPFIYYIYSYAKHEEAGCCQVVRNLDSYLEYARSNVKADAKPYVYPTGEVIIGEPNNIEKPLAKMFKKDVTGKKKGEVA